MPSSKRKSASSTCNRHSGHIWGYFACLLTVLFGNQFGCLGSKASLGDFWSQGLQSDGRLHSSAAYRPRQITTYLADELSPAVNPKTEELLYVSNLGGNRDIWVRPLGGGLPHRLTEHSADDFDPAVSPDGEMVAFASNRFDAKGDLFLAKADGSDLKRITDRKSGDRQPAWFPDGKRLAFTSVSDEQDQAVYVFNLDTSQKDRLTKRMGFSPSISPDGRFLLFTSLVHSEGASLPCLWVKRFEDGREEPLHLCDRPEGFGTWALEAGTLQIVFSRFNDDTNADGRLDLQDRPGLWRMHFDDFSGVVPKVGYPLPLTPATSADITPLVYGQTVYFASRVEGDLDIWSLPLSSPESIESCAAVIAKVEEVVDPLEGLFLLRRAVGQLAGTADGDLCAIREAELLLKSGRVGQAAEAYIRISRSASEPELRDRALLGNVAASMEQMLALGMSPTQQDESRSIAESLLTELTRIKVSQAQKELVKADIHRRIGNFSEALESLGLSLSTESKDDSLIARAHILKGDVLQALGNFSESLSNYLRVLQMAGAKRSKTLEAAQRIIDLVQKTSVAGLTAEDPVERLEGILRRWPGVPVLPGLARVSIGELHRQNNKRQLARRSFLQIESQPGVHPEVVSQALLSLSQMAEEDGDLSEALDHANELINRFRSNPKIRLKAGQRIKFLAQTHALDLMMRGETGMAIKVYRQLIAQEPDDVVAHRQLIALISLRGQAYKALDIYRTRLENRPGDDLSLYLYGLVLTYVDPPDYFDEALEVIEQALAINSQMAFAHQTLGWIFEQRAKMKHDQDEYHKSAESYQAALSLLDVQLHPRAEADLLLNLGNVHFSLGNYRQAYSYYKKRELTEIGFTQPLRRMVYLEQFGRSALLSENMEDAVSCFSRAVALTRELKMKKRLPWLLASEAAAYQLSNKFHLAAETFQDACALYAKSGTNNRLASCRRNVAYNLYMAGRKRQAATEFAKAQNLLSKHGSSVRLSGEEVSVSLADSASRAAYGFDREGELNFLFTFQGRLFSEAGDLVRARLALRNKVSLLRQHIEKTADQGLMLDLAIAVNQLAVVRLAAGDAKHAAGLFKEAAWLAKGVSSVWGVAVNSINRLDLMLSGEVELDPKEILSELQIALDTSQTAETVDETIKLRLLNAIGTVFAHIADRPGQPAASRQVDFKDKFDQSVRLLDRALMTLTRAEESFSKAWQLSKNLKGYKGSLLRIQSGWNLAEVLARKGQKAKAKKIFDQVRKLVDDQLFVEVSWRLEGPDDDPLSRAKILLDLPPEIAGTDNDLLARKAREALFMRLVGQALDNADNQAAFKSAETLLIRRRLDALDLTDLKPADQADKDYLKGLSERITYLKESLSKLRMPKQSSLESNRLSARQALEQFVSYRDRGGKPRDYVRQLFGSKVISLAEFAAILDPGEVIVETLALPERLAIFVVDRKGLNVFQSPVGRKHVQAEVNTLRGSDSLKKAVARANLSKWLIGPLAERLTKAKSIIAVTDDLDIPLEYLIYNGKSLIRSIPVTHIYSASDLPAFRKKRNLNLKRAVWVGPQPAKETTQVLKTTYGSVRQVTKTEEVLDAVGGSGLVVWALPWNSDPLRPLRTSIGPDKVVGSLGGISLGSLAQVSSKSGIWMLAGPKQKLDGSVAGAGLEAAMLAAQVPVTLVVPDVAKQGPAKQVMHQMIAQLATVSPSEALSKTIENLSQAGHSWKEFLSIQLRGDPGMDAQARKKYAESALQGAVGAALAAYKSKDWKKALAWFLEVRTLALYLNNTKILPTIDQRIVKSAFYLSEFDLAAEYERKILEQARIGGQKLQVARAQQFLGILESRSGRNKQAVSWLKTAISDFDALGNEAEAALASATLALALDASSDYQKTIGTAEDALARFEKNGNELQALRMLRLIGTTYLKRLNMVSTARDWFDKARELAQKLGKKDKVAAILLDLARTELASGSYEQALHLARAAQKLSESISDSSGQAAAWLEQANGLWYLGEYQRAFVAQRRAQKFAEQAKDVRLGIRALSLGGLITMNLGDLDSAGDSLSQALLRARQAGLSDEEAVQLNNLGIVSREKGDLEKANSLFSEALVIDTRLKSTLGKAYDLRNLGIVEQMMGNLDQASQYLETAIKLTRSIGDRFNEVKVLHGLARLDMIRGRLNSAHEYAKVAHDLSVQLGLKEVTWRALRTMGEIARRKGQMEGAQAYYYKAISVVEQMRASLKVEQFRSGFLDNKYDLYEDMINLLLDMGKDDEAFSYSERSRARGFLDLLANRKVEVGSEGTRAILKDVRRIKRKMARLAEEVRRAPDTDRDQATAVLAQTHETYIELLNQLRSINPGLTDFVEVRPATPKEIQQILRDDVALLAYYVTDESTIVWLITRDKIVGRRIEIEQKKLAEQVSQVRRLIENFAPIDSELMQLYSLLVKPLATELQGYRFVGVLPHDVLNYLPFSALKPDSKTYWSDSVRIFASPSASVLAVLHRRFMERFGPAGGLLSLGNPDLGDPTLDLPFAEQEARAVGYEQAGSQVFVKDQASETKFRKQAPASEFIHLASHGTFDPLSPLKSALLLAPEGEQDGKLTALEVFSLPLSARLVTLSACQTGLGKITSGDEIIGFNRAFLSAGAASILSSLWRVSDVATAVLMKRFYRFMRTDSTLEALHKAQQVVRRYYPHPAYWSGFMLIGTWL
ncbi:MAG: CHAT domain-containing protein [Deltaproteobacteria bacterium]|nr:CHAT domain-containing protein [Deltaproteobacteria bacterium]